MTSQSLASSKNQLIHNDDQLSKAYRSLILSSLRTSFPSFVRNYEFQEGLVAQRGRVASIDFEEDGKISVNRFDSLTHLKRILDNEAPSLYIVGQPPRRRLYLLEDIARDYVDTLGSRLRIPPSVFAAHWSDPATSGGTYDDTFLVSHSPHYFRLRYRQLHKVRGDYPLGLYGDRNSNVPRWLQLLDKGRLYESSEHHFSFWGSEYGQGSWIGRCTVSRVTYLFVQKQNYGIDTTLAHEVSS